MNYLVGSTVLVRITVRDDEGDLSDGTVDLVIQAPDGTETSESPTHTSTGIYDFYLDLDEEGWWTAIWTVTVANFTSVIECTVCAKASVMAGSSA